MCRHRRFLRFSVLRPEFVLVLRCGLLSTRRFLYWFSVLRGGFLDNLLTKFRLISSLSVPVSFALIRWFRRSASIGLALIPRHWPDVYCLMVIGLLGRSMDPDVGL